jgi:hydroxypyruvate reductase
MPVSVLSFDTFPSFIVDKLNANFDFNCIDKNDAAALAALAPKVRALVAKGETVINDALMARLPNLEIIALCSVGYDGIDVAAARRRGIPVTNTPGVLTDDVADLAIALMLGVARRVVAADQHVRSGAWSRGAFPLNRKVSGSRLGIVGLGRIGQAIAKRAEAFGMSIAYTARGRKADLPYTFYPNAQALAKDVDFLIVSTPGGAETRGMINAAVLDALGPDGYLINVARGSVVDEPALVAARRRRHHRDQHLQLDRDRAGRLRPRTSSTN